MFTAFFPKKYLGLDIGNSAVKIAEVAVSRSRITVTRLIKAQLPPQDPEQHRDMVPVAQALCDLAQKHQLRDKGVYSNLSGAYVASRLFTLPAMAHHELLAYIRSHASEYFPASVKINEVEFDFHLLKEEFKEGQESVQLMLAAGRKKAVISQLEMIEQAGLLPAALDASSLSLLNSFVAHPAMLTGKPLAIIDIGHSLTKVMVVKDQMVNFVTEVALGGDAITRAIAQKYSLEHQQAEDVKLKLSLLAKIEDEDVITIGGQRINASEIYQTVLPVMKQLAGELQKVRRFLLIDKAWQFMLLTGGASRSFGLKDTLESELLCPADMQDTINGLEIGPPLNQEVPEFSLAIGLALKAIRPFVNRIDLIPASERLRVEDKMIVAATGRFAKASGLALAVISAAFLLAWLGSGYVCRRTDLKFKTISTEWQKAKQLRDINAELLRGSEILNGIPAQRAGLAPALADLSQSAPQNLWLTALDIKGRMQPGQEDEADIFTTVQCRLAGYSIAQEQVLSLVKSLEKSKVFEKPELKYLEKIGDNATGSLPGTAGNYKFEITVNLK
ncbi:pilus assembly protein PilM [candidate division TA06 bacterium]|nr:pilus assembly protein PilM [candidate division TA06 bacterium]